MKSQKIYFAKLGLITSVIVIGALFYLFDSFINKIATESLSNWLKVEEATILEGNLLTSVTKNQRAIYSSEFLKGFMLADFSKPGQLEQISFGDPIDPKLIDLKLLKEDKVKTIGTGLFRKYAAALIPHSESKVIIFSFWSEDLYKIFFYSCLLIFSVILFFGYLLAKSKKKAHEKALLYAEKAARVSHDIRSPLIQLSASIERISDPSIKDQLNDVSQRIVDITNDLVLNQKKVAKKEISQVYVKIPTLKESIGNLVHAKKETYPHIEFELDDSSQGIPIALAHSELMRSLSNLLENSIEAVQENGLIKILIKDNDESLEVVIQDNGKGIPKEILPMIGTKGTTFGKANGSGLGIYYAQLSLSEVGGSFKIDSIEGQGATIKLNVPFQKTRALSNNKIQIEEGSTLLILDDDYLIRTAWALVLSKKNLPQIDVKYFSTSKEILESKLDLKSAFLLTDYDLKEDLDGLDVVGRLKMQDRSLLVTGMASSLKVQAKAKATGNVPILDKESLEQICFEVVR